MHVKDNKEAIATHRDTPDADKIVPGVRHDVSNTRPIVSEVRRDAENTRTSASDICRDKLKAARMWVVKIGQ